MKKCTCGCDNADGAKFCRACGRELSIMNIMDKYPNMKFRPISFLLVKSRENQRKVLLIVFSVALIITILCSIQYVSNQGEYWYERSIKECLLFVGSEFLYFLAFYFITGKSPTTETIRQFRLSVDYYQSSFSFSPYRFYVKANKWGLFVNGVLSIQIPAEYDELKWKEKGKLLYAKKNGYTAIIDINGNVLK